MLSFRLALPTLAPLCLAGSSFLFFLLGGCKSFPEVPLTTPEPIKVDPIEVKVRIDLYQHAGDAPTPLEEAATAEEVIERQRNRMSEIQELKDNRIVGENHRGLLDIRHLPGGNWDERIKEAVEEENWDRLFLMKHEAKRKEVLLHEIEHEQWIRRKELSFEGEWIQEENTAKEGTYKWVPKTK